MILKIKTVTLVIDQYDKVWNDINDRQTTNSLEIKIGW